MIFSVTLLAFIAAAHSTCFEPTQGNSVNAQETVRYTIEELGELEGDSYAAAFGALKSAGEVRSELFAKRTEVREKLMEYKERGNDDKVEKFKQKKQAIDGLISAAERFNSVADLLEDVQMMSTVSSCYNMLLEEIAASVEACEQGNEYINCLKNLRNQDAEKCEVIPGTTPTGVYCAVGLSDNFVREFNGQLFVDMQIVGVTGNREDCQEAFNNAKDFNFDKQASSEVDMGISDVPELNELVSGYEDKRAELKTKIQKLKSKGNKEEKVERLSVRRDNLADQIDFLESYGDDFLLESLPEQLFINVLSYRCRQDLLSRVSTCLTSNIDSVERARACEYSAGTSAARGNVFYTVGCEVGLKDDRLHFPMVTIAKRV